MHDARARGEGVIAKTRGLVPAAVLALALTAAHAQTSGADVEPEPPSVGMTAWLRDVVLPGSELEPAPSDATTPIVLRVADVSPHGDALRYDLAYYGTEPGRYDLRDYLRRRDGTSTSDLPELPVTVRSVLPPERVRPHAPQPARTPRLGGYRTLLVLGALAWLAGGVVLFGRRRRRTAHESDDARQETLADRLRPLVEQAMHGDLTETGRAELELALIAYWRRRLGLESTGTAASLATLREHPEAGALLRQLEAWLHAPVPAAPVDVGALLAPYRDLPAEPIDVTQPTPATPGAA